MNTGQPLVLLRNPDGSYSQGLDALKVAWRWVRYWFVWYVYYQGEQE